MSLPVENARLMVQSMRFAGHPQSDRTVQGQAGIEGGPRNPRELPKL